MHNQIFVRILDFVLSSPEEKKLVKAVVWVVLPRSLLRTTTESLRYDRLMSYASIGDWLSIETLTQTFLSLEEQSKSQQQFTSQDSEVRSQVQKLENASNGDSVRLGDPVVVVVVEVVVVVVVVVVVIVVVDEVVEVVSVELDCFPLTRGSVTLSS